MKRITITMILLILFLDNVNAQINFTLADPQPDLNDVYGGSFASGDIDNDGDQDLLMTGLGPGVEAGTALYLNDGNGDFAEVTNTPFPEARISVTEFIDLDADGDLDLYFSGIAFDAVQEFTHIYLNDGTGSFTQLSNPLLPEFQGSGAAIEDVDDDGDLDIMISAIDANDDFVADVYLNDGNANFTPAGSTAFIPVKFASVAFLDSENDGDADIIISGVQSNDVSLTALYLNDGAGNYSLDPNTNFEQLSADDVDVADTDNDGDLDILMSGMNDANNVRTILYVNDGSGQFTELSTGMQDTFAGSNAIADFDNDGDQDIVIIGSQDGGLPNIFNIVYENLGNNEFIEVDVIGGEYIANNVVDDFNGDGLSDIIILGFADGTNAYWNTGENLGTTDFSNSQTITMFPNPANDIVNISSDKDKLQRIELYSMTGSLIFKADLNSKNYALNVSNYPIGTYLLRVFNQNNGTLNTKIIKK
ncbi:FG-GAP-like repeat-containing protein [Psychroserpens sp.]|uniref:FG-GAP-like repeat-containing protein n=1 Tax=Psychroserpens sp. TaxID=2020870 RepID=UPI00385C5AA1